MFKRIILSIAAFTMALMLIPAATVMAEVRYGDIDQDGKVNASDLVCLENYLNEELSFNSEKSANADVVYDGTVDWYDLIKLRNYLNMSSDVLGSANKSVGCAVIKQNIGKVTNGFPITPYTIKFVQYGTVTGKTFSAVDSTPLPAGLSLSGAGVISGTPTAVATEKNYKVQVDDTNAIKLWGYVSLEVVEPYTVTLDCGNGTGGTTQVLAGINNPMPAITVPTRTGYAFMGYYTGANGTGTKYYTSIGASARNCDLTDDTTLYAYWAEENTYIITKDTQGYHITGVQTSGTLGTFSSAISTIGGYNSEANPKIIRFENGTDELDVGAFYASIDFPCKLTGKLKGSASSLINISEGVSVESEAYITNVNSLGATIRNSGTLTVSGGEIKSTGTDAYSIMNCQTGTTAVSGGKVSSTGNSAYAVYNVSTGTINVSGGAVEAAKYAVYNQGAGAVNVSRGTVSSTAGNAVYNATQGAVSISGGTVSTSGNCAVYNASTGKITVSQASAGVPTTVTSANVNTSQGTIYLNAGSSTDTVLEVTGGRIENTTANGNTVYNGKNGNVVVRGGTISSTTGNAICNAVQGTINISGGNVSATSGHAVNNASDGTVNVSDGTVSSTSVCAIRNNTGTAAVIAPTGKAPYVGDNQTSAYAVRNFNVTATENLYKYISIGDIIPLAFTDNAAYDIPEGDTGTAVTAVDVSGGVSGGVRPYTFSSENIPSWLSITGAGVISGTRPATPQVASNVTVKVSDGRTPAYTQTIVISVGAVNYPVYDVELHTNSGTINVGNVTSYTYATGATLPTDVTRTGFTFGGWYDNAAFNGSAVTAITATDTGNKEYWAKWNNATYTAAVTPASLDFGRKLFGYAAAPSAQTVTITNNGSGDITGFSVDDADYDIVYGATTSIAANGGTAAFTVQPKTGLAAGSHNKTLTVVTVPAQTTALTFDVSFNVDAVPVLSSTSYGTVNAGTVVTLSVTAVPNADYKWYSNNTDSNQNGTLINGAASTSYTPPTANAGTVYYYCTINGIATNVVAVTINAVTPAVVKAPEVRREERSTARFSSKVYGFKDSWDGVKRCIEAMKPGDSREIVMASHVKVVPRSIIEALNGKDVTITFVSGNDRYVINGKDIKKVKTIDITKVT